MDLEKGGQSPFLFWIKNAKKWPMIMQWCRLKTIFSFYLCSKPGEGKHISTFLLECSLLSVVLCRNSLSSSHNLPTPQTSSEAKGTFLVLCLLVVYLSFASKIGWRSRENYLITTSRHQLWLCPHNCGKVILVSVELLLVQSVQGKKCSPGFSRCSWGRKLHNEPK